MARDPKHTYRQRTIDALLRQPRTTETFGDELSATLEAIRPPTPPDVARAIADIAAIRGDAEPPIRFEIDDDPPRTTRRNTKE